MSNEAKLHSQRKQYLYVHVVKARALLEEDSSGGCDLHVEVLLGNHKKTTSHLTFSQNNPNPEWNQVFTFSRDKIEAYMLELTVKDSNAMKDDFMGWVLYDLCEIPKPDCPVCPLWYRLADRKGDELKGQLMFAVWWGTRTDEAFPGPDSDDHHEGRVISKVYLSPKLWYLRVNVIEGHDLVPSDRTRSPQSFVKVTLGNQTVRTRFSMKRTENPLWNEEWMFVAADPFEEQLILSVQDKVAPNKYEVLGSCIIPLQYVERRVDDRYNIHSRWFNLQRDVSAVGHNTKQAKFSSRIHMGICLEGGYHVLDESVHYSSDFRPTAKQLWKKSVGIFELGILSAHGLSPMKTKDGSARADAYCVAKYGMKWVRTRTIVNSLTPKWNEQYTWEVFDPCTVVTIGVFDNCHLQGGDNGNGASDSRIGMVRIRLSTLETNRVYTHSYPLLVLHPSGVKKMGEIHLAMRFTCSSLLNMMHMYSQPLLPKMHYIYPLTVTQLDSLRHQAAQIVSMRLSRAEPPLRKEVVEYMLDVGNTGIMRRTKANFLRMKGVFDGLIAVGKWFGGMYNGENPIRSVVVHFIFFILAMYPELILPSIFLLFFITRVWNYRHRPTYPHNIDACLAHPDNARPDELDKEFDTFQRMVGDIATQGERVQSLLSWREPVATSLFVFFCLIAAIVLYATPFYVVAIQTDIYVLTQLSSQNKRPSALVNFFRRLPATTDSML